MYPKPSFIKAEFNDFDRFANIVKQGDIEHIQLSVGRFNGTLQQVMYGPVILSRHAMNQTILQRGQGIEGYTTFLIPGNMRQDFIWRKSQLKGNVIGILKSGLEHNCITKQNFYGLPVSIENNYLKNLSFNLGYLNFMTIINRAETFEIRPETAQNLHNIIQKNCSREGLNEQEILVQIPKTIIESISVTIDSKSLLKGNSRRRIFKKGQEFMHDSAENPSSIIEICRYIGVSERNLRYAFKDQTGLSPKKYLQHYRLNQVRKILKSGDFDKIVDVAHRFGYWHTGQFAADYKKLFGELPSET